MSNDVPDVAEVEDDIVAVVDMESEVDEDVGDDKDVGDVRVEGVEDDVVRDDDGCEEVGG